MGKKPELKDLYSAKETIIKDKYCLNIELIIHDIKCPICDMTCHSLIKSEAFWGKYPENTFYLNSEYNIKCNNGCGWNYLAFHTCDNYQFGYYDIEGWERICDYWEKINKEYKIYENIYYDVQIKRWYKYDNKEESICPCCLNKNICIYEDVHDNGKIEFRCQQKICRWCYIGKDIGSIHFNKQLQRERATTLNRILIVNASHQNIKNRYL